MDRTFTIADAHSKNEPAQRIELPANGGSPWYAYVWINDELFTIFKDDTTDEITVSREA